MRYSDHIDYLVASTLYLGTQKYWWARTPHEMARELSLDEQKLTTVFDGFPAIFRKSPEPSESGAHTYSLQARYAQHEREKQEDIRKSYIHPLDTDKMRLLHEFILKSAEDERSGRRAVLGYGILILAAVLSAMSAIYSATIRPSPAPPDVVLRMVAPPHENTASSTSPDNGGLDRAHTRPGAHQSRGVPRRSQ